MRYLLLGGRRKSARRDSDRKEYIYVDQYRPWLLVAIMLLAILSISDGLFTLHLIDRGATEKNPVMAWFLSRGAWPFMIAKFILANSAALILLIFHNYYFRLSAHPGQNPDPRLRRRLPRRPRLAAHPGYFNFLINRP